MISATNVVVPAGFRIAQLVVLIGASGAIASAGGISTGATFILLLVLTVVGCAVQMPGWLVAGAIGLWAWCMLALHAFITDDPGPHANAIALGVVALLVQVSLSMLCGEPRLRRSAGSTAGPLLTRRQRRKPRHGP